MYYKADPVRIDLARVKSVKLNDKCKFDLEFNHLYYKDKQVKLTRYQENLIQYLILNNGSVMEYEAIYNHSKTRDVNAWEKDKAVIVAVNKIHNFINPDKKKPTDEDSKPTSENNNTTDKKEKRKNAKNTQTIIGNESGIGCYISIKAEDLIYKPVQSEFNAPTNQDNRITNRDNTPTNQNNRITDRDDSITNPIVQIDRDYCDLICQQIADAYYVKYKEIVLGNSREEKKRPRRSLIDVFLYPDFVGNKKLDLTKNNSINSNIYYICAPNGFGKTTLLKSILFSTNPPTNLKDNYRINDLQEIYNIKKKSLTLFVDVSPIKEISIVKTGTEISKWLLKASDIQGHNGFKITTDEFREVISYFNNREQLILIFDGIDELREKAREEVDRIDIINKIKELTEGDSICKNAKVIIAARPMVSENISLPYEYYNIKPLTNSRDKVKKIIDKYSPEYAEEIKDYIFKDRYLENLVATPQLLSELVYRCTVDKNNETSETGGPGKIEWDNEKFKIIKKLISRTITRFKNKGNLDYRDIIYQPIYETFSYASLFNKIPNGEGDFSRCANIIKHYELKYPESSRIDINDEHLKEAYEHYSLFDTQNDDLAFLAPITLRAYYLAKYIYAYYKNVYDNSCDLGKKWDMIDKILDSIDEGEDHLCDMLIFYFGLMIDGDEGIVLDPDDEEYKLWTDYIVYKLKDKKTSGTLKKKIKDSLKYLVNERFIKTTFFNNILADPESENEEYLRSILKEIMKK